MLRNESDALRVQHINVLHMLRALLHQLELSKQLSAETHEQVLEARLRTDREIEALR
jgi:hypothetical protein